MIEIGWSKRMAQYVSYKHYQHKVGLAILIFEKGVFKENKITRSQETLHNDKSINSQGRQVIPNVCAPNNKTSKYRKHKLRSWREKIDISTIIAYSWDFEISLSATNRTSREKIITDTKNSTLLPHRV